MRNSKIIQRSSGSSSDDTVNLISNALSGTTGGALLGSSFGLLGGILGGLVGGFFTGYSGYRMIYKKQGTAKDKTGSQNHR